MSNREVLIIEDDAKFRNVIKFALKSKDYRFFESGSVFEGLRKLDENPNIQVILLDLSLPDGTGKDFLEQITNHTSRPKIIILTAHEEALAARQALEFGVFNYLPKAAASFTQSIRFSVDQAFKDIERESLEQTRQRWVAEKESLIKKTEALLEIQGKINRDLPLNEILDLICESLLNLTGAYTCHIRLYNLKTGDFDLASFAGPAKAIRKLFSSPKRKGDFFSGKVAETKLPHLFEDLQNDEEFQALREHLLKTQSPANKANEYLDRVQSAYIAPMTTHIFADETDAVLSISADSREFFSEEKQEIIEEFCTQAILAVTRAWQKRRKTETHLDYQGISQVLEGISQKLSEEYSKRDLYDIVIDGIARIVKPETISIFLYNKASGLLDTIAEFKGNERMPASMSHPSDQGLTGSILTRREALRIPNLQIGDKHRPQDHVNYNQQLEWEYVQDIPSKRIDHYLGVPMQIGGEIIGVIQLLNKKSDYYGEIEDKERWLLERGFSDDCESVLGIAASYLAVAIKNADLIEERNRKIRQLDTLKDVGRFTSSEKPLDELLNNIITDAAEDIQAEICLLFLLDESKHQVVLEQSYGIPKENLKYAHYEIGEGLAGVVALTGRPILKRAEIPLGKYDAAIVEYLRQTHGKKKTLESLMVVPIKVKGEILGVIKAINKKGDLEQYNQEDLSFFEAFANYVGIAIENTQRYNLTNEKLAIAQKNVALSHLVRAVVHEINNTKALIPINVQMIRDRISRSNYEIEEMINVIDDAAKQAVTFANSIQAFSASWLGKREAQDINAIVQKALLQLAPGLEQDRRHKLVKVEQRLSVNLPKCYVYQTPLIQVFQNVILNAYQAMEKSEKKLLTIASSEDVDRELVNIEFTDTGHGIESGILEAIFDPEFTTKEGKGTGIGLWLAKTHLDSIDAEINVKSVLHQGTTFTIQIPVSPMGILD